MAERGQLVRDGDAMPGRVATLALAALALAFAVLIFGGYRLGWTWTGFADNGTIWDWLQLLVLPVVLTLLPVWYRTRRSLRIEWRGAASALVLAAIVLVVGGYAYGWHFTGFPGKTLWDWLDLLVLPVALTLLPVSLEASWGRFRETRLVLTIAGVALGLLVVAGYALDWEWTGFRGNTFWDWLHLLLVPFLLPAAVTWLSARAREAPEAAPAPRADLP
jgi:heme/copper-type cytochrome/quinol oxidase subunit 4